MDPVLSPTVEFTGAIQAELPSSGRDDTAPNHRTSAAVVPRIRWRGKGLVTSNRPLCWNAWEQTRAASVQPQSCCARNTNKYQALYSALRLFRMSRKVQRRCGQPRLFMDDWLRGNPSAIW